MADTDIKHRYPEIEVQLTGQDGNAFAVLGQVRTALKSADVPVHEIDLFMEEVTAGDYDHLLQTCMRWVKVN